ncbi:T9SS type B sorting domain-containing protein [Gilvibacter sediminis]|uniref:T9SS type B sorting domain-containing protein n=1 Tax=Gilvibacter sediminis TaxID=379071 RepID=UPI002350B2CC|nr:T9SS type B sorting domain-containing protein [Gilvibacter sediminis]MDC7999036.1 T9SS type B sorting domain-containing protein [Gilvibacter sediminis]
MKRVLLLSLLLLVSLAHGQREAANWFFGSNAGLDFNSGEPVPRLDGVLNTVEGCETISTPEGSLLFYTEGRNVWNRIHEVMPNGEDLNGSFSATQSALVIPQPGSTNLYYIFTSDVVQAYQDGGAGNGFNYSVVDMNLAGGLGDISEKNVNLLPQGSEKITGVRAADGENYWVITHFENRFYSYFVDDTGLNPTPVISTIGPNINDFNNIRGAIKASPDGDQLAVAHSIFQPNFSGQFLLYDFNTETGVVSNEVVLGTDLVFYGVEFSADSSKLYASGKTINGDTGATENINIIQYDLEAPDVVASRFTVADIPNPFISDLAGSLQIAIDKKIYHSIPNNNLSVIRTPNFPRLDSDFRLYDTDLGGRSTKFGLPPFIQSFFESIVDIENFCLGDETAFTITADDPIVAVNWNFGDPASGAANTSTLINPTHIFSGPGVYTVTLDVEYETRPTQRYIEFVEIGDAPIVNSGVQLVQCDIDGVDDGISRFNLNEALTELIGDPRGFTVNFFRTLADAENNENALPEIGYENEFNGQVVYVRVFENALCFAIAPVTLIVEPMAYAGDVTLVACNRSDNPDFEAIVDLVDFEAQLLELYPGAEISFFDTRDDALLELNPLVDQVQFTAFDTELAVYYRVEYNNDCAFIGRIIPDIRPVPEAQDITLEICPDENEIILDPGDYAGYLWDNGETTRTIAVSDPGVYVVDVFNGVGCNTTVTVNVVAIPVPASITVVVADFQDRNTVTVEIEEEGPWQYQLDGGLLQSDNVFTDVLAGPRRVAVYAEDCLIYEEDIFVGGAPNYFTPNGDGFHDLWHIFNAREFPGATIKIFDRYGKILKNLRHNQLGWDGNYRGNPMPSSDYWYLIELPDGRSARGHFSLIRR